MSSMTMLSLLKVCYVGGVSVESRQSMMFQKSSSHIYSISYVMKDGEPWYINKLNVRTS